MNAIVHKDYNSVNGFMHILLYPNRLEIANYGVLPSMESVIVKGGEGVSMLRNPGRFIVPSPKIRCPEDT